MSNLLAIDPGLVTGIAIKVGDDYSVFEYSPYPTVWQLVSSQPWDQVIIENFTAQDISKYGIITVRIIGGVEALCTYHKIPLTVQQNIMRIPFKFRAEQLLIAKYGAKPARDHRLDALAHMLCWESKNAKV